MRTHIYSHAPISFYFSHTPRDFVVSEIPLYEFSAKGEHQILELRKKNLTTFELIKILSSYFGCHIRDIGYAGLKDKSATTTQFVSIPKKYTTNLEGIIEHIATQYEIKLISSTYHNNKLRLGHLKGNRFFVRLKKVSKANASKLESILAQIQTYGFGNYFGFQRFGNDGDNYILGRDIAHKKAKIKDRKLSDFLISSYQSHLFNQWLSKRVRLSVYLNDLSPSEAKEAFNREGLAVSIDQIKQLCSQPHIFKIFEGDICCHYPYGKLFSLESHLTQELHRFNSSGFSPTGALSGKGLKPASKLAFEVEREFLDSKLLCVGSRRFAWIWLSGLEFAYKAQEAHFELHFTLPKGAYATTLLEEIAGAELLQASQEA